MLSNYLESIFYYIGIFYFFISKKCPGGLEDTYMRSLLKILTVIYLQWLKNNNELKYSKVFL
jgi:hypothetical protein